MKDISNDIMEILDAIQTFHHLSIIAALLGLDDYVKKSDEAMIEALDSLRNIIKE